MQVVALEPGFHGGIRRRTGDIFDMDESGFKKKDGQPVMPKWVKAAPNAQAAKAEAAKAQKAEQERLKNGAIAASGKAAAKAKVDAVAQHLGGDLV